MKKALLLIASAMLLFTGCAKERLGQNVVPDGETVQVNIETSLPISTQTTKAVWDNDGNAANVDHWIMEVYDKDDALYDRKELTGQTGLTKTFKVTLIKNQTYKFVFWADKEGSYETSNLTDIKTILSSDSREAGKDALDAFFCKKEYKSTMNESISAVLTRPFGQINIVTLDTKKVFDEIGDASEYGKFMPKNLKVTATVYNGFNALAGTLADLKKVTLTELNCYGKTPYSYAEHKDSTTLFMDYLFVSAEQELVDLAFEFESNGEKVEYAFASIPLQRNYRTNIFGNLLSNDAEWNVVIDPTWYQPDYEVERWSPGMISPITPDDEGIYNVEKPSQLAWIAQQVNSGNTFSGKIVKLANDIDLNNGAWTPMGGVSSYPSVAFHGTLDGNNHKILNLNCSDNTQNYASAALIGAGHCTVKDLTLENVKVSSTHYAAALVGYVGDGGLVLTNCNVKNGTITSTPEWLGTEYDNGDKVGGLLGYCAGACTINGCSVEGLAIKAYRDLGGIAGAANCADVKNNVVKNAELTADQSVNFYGKKDYNAGAIVGRALAGTVDASNTSENVVIKTFGNAIEKALDEAEPGATVEVPATAESFGTINVPANLADGVTLKAAEGAKVDEIIIPDDADIKDFTVQGFTGNRTSSAALQSGFVGVKANAKVENLVVESCTFIGPGSKTGGAGVWIQSSTAACPKTITIKDSQFSGLRYGVYTANQIEGVEVVVDGCSFENMLSWAILINNRNIKSMSIKNCTFEGGSQSGDHEGTNAVKIANGATPADFTFTFTDNVVTKEYANITVQAKASQTTMSGNKKNGAAWTPSITILPE